MRAFLRVLYILIILYIIVLYLLLISNADNFSFEFFSM